MSGFTFPFGQSVRALKQADRTAKSVFVVGVYASAVHAVWRSAEGKVLVRALAVASEPGIFWKGDGAKDLVAAISVPPEVGSLAATGKDFNGPSGRALDDLFLTPLGLTRHDAWLCDLLPESRVNGGQAAAIRAKYEYWADRGIVPPATVPNVPRVFTDEGRRSAITRELLDSQADTIITLGDVPIRDYLKHVTTLPFRRLADANSYGEEVNITVAGRPYKWLPLVHPRQAAGLGTASKRWTETHRAWSQRRGSRPASRPDTT